MGVQWGWPLPAAPSSADCIVADINNLYDTEDAGASVTEVLAAQWGNAAVRYFDEAVGYWIVSGPHDASVATLGWSRTGTGADWHPITADWDGQNAVINDVAHANGMYVGVGSNSDTLKGVLVGTSVSGGWATAPTSWDGGSFSLDAVAYFQGRWFAGGRQPSGHFSELLLSAVNPRSTWTYYPTGLESSVLGAVYAMCVGTPVSGAMFTTPILVVGGQPWGGAHQIPLAWTEDGVTFHAGELICDIAQNALANVYGIAFNGYCFVAVGDAYEDGVPVAYSFDGKHWYPGGGLWYSYAPFGTPLHLGPFSGGYRFTGRTAVPVSNTDWVGGGIGDYVYVTGTGGTRRFDPDGGSWLSLTNIPTPVAGACAVAHEDKIYVFGGATSPPTPTTLLQIYDPATDTWSSGAPIPTARYWAAAVVGKDDGLIYLLGGRSAGGSPIPTVEYYNSGSNTWFSAPDMPTARYGHGAALLRDRIYVVGGWEAGPVVSGRLESYDPPQAAWTSGLASLPNPRGWPGVAADRDRLICAGGFASGTAQDSVYLYDAVRDIWAETARMPTAKFLTPLIPCYQRNFGPMLAYIGGSTSLSTTTQEVRMAEPEPDAYYGVTWDGKNQKFIAVGDITGLDNPPIGISGWGFINTPDGVYWSFAGHQDPASAPTHLAAIPGTLPNAPPGATPASSFPSNLLTKLQSTAEPPGVGATPWQSDPLVGYTTSVYFEPDGAITPEKFTSFRVGRACYRVEQSTDTGSPPHASVESWPPASLPFTGAALGNGFACYVSTLYQQAPIDLELAVRLYDSTDSFLTEWVCSNDPSVGHGREDVYDVHGWWDAKRWTGFHFTVPSAASKATLRVRFQLAHRTDVVWMDRLGMLVPDSDHPIQLWVPGA